MGKVLLLVALLSASRSSAAVLTMAPHRALRAFLASPAPLDALPDFSALDMRRADLRGELRRALPGLFDSYRSNEHAAAKIEFARRVMTMPELRGYFPGWLVEMAVEQADMRREHLSGDEKAAIDERLAGARLGIVAALRAPWEEAAPVEAVPVLAEGHRLFKKADVPALLAASRAHAAGLASERGAVTRARARDRALERLVAVAVSEGPLQAEARAAAAGIEDWRVASSALSWLALNASRPLAVEAVLDLLEGLESSYVRGQAVAAARAMFRGSPAAADPSGTVLRPGRRFWRTGARK